MANLSFQEVLQQMQKQEEEARLANLKRYEQGLAIYDEIIRRYQPGGPFEARALEQLQTQKTADVGAGAQRLISAGLFGTEAGAGLEAGWERAVGAPARLRLEDIMMQRLSQAQIGKVGFLERREDVYPNLALLASLAAQAAPASPTTYTRTLIINRGKEFPSLPGRAPAPKPPEETPYYRTPEYFAKIERQKREAEEVRAAMAKQKPIMGAEKVPIEVETKLIKYGAKPGQFLRKTIYVPKSVLGPGGPAGFISESEYKRYVPRGFVPVSSHYWG